MLVPSDFASVLGRSLLINTGAMFALAAPSDYLADQVRHATTHVEAQQEQIDNLAALHADVIRCLTSGLITIDARGRVLTVNEAAAEMLRVDAQQAQWRPLAQLVPELASVRSTWRRSDGWQRASRTRSAIPWRRSPAPFNCSGRTAASKATTAD